LRREEASYLGHLHHVQLLNIKHAAQTVGSICVKVRSVAILGTLVEIVVAPNELLQLGLHVEDLVLGEIVLDDGDLGGFEVSQETKLTRLQEQQRPSLGVVAPSSPTDAVDVITRVIGRVKLDNPVNLRNIEATSGDVGAD
jgi:hypothetical protein